MAGRLGRIGDDNSTTRSSGGGRLGKLEFTPVEVKSYDEENKKKKKEEQRKQFEKIDADVKKSKDAVWNPINILGDIGNAAKSAGKALFVDPFVTAKQQGEVSIKGGQTSLDKGSLQASPEAVKSEIEYTRSEQKKGTISKEKADARIAKLQGNQTKATEKLQKAENEVGVTFDPSAGALSTIDAVGLATGLGEIGQVVFRKAAETQAKKIGRELGGDELNDLAVKTKNTVPEPKPTQAEQVLKSTDEPVITRTTPVTESPTIGASDAITPTVKPPKTFAPLDQTTHAKVVKLVDDSGKTPVKEGHTRLYQTQDSSQAGKQSDQYFKDVDTLSNYVNGRSDNAKLNFVDVPNEKVASVPGKPQVFKIADEGTPITPKAEPVKPEGDTVSGNASRIEAKAIEKKLTENFGDLPQYKSINMKEQADEAVKLIKNDRKLAEDIIDGKANPPGNLKAQSIHQALEDRAIRDGDVDLLQKLAKSPINTELSESAQKLRIAAERDPHSAVENIRSVQDARAKMAETRSKTTVKKEATNIRKKVEASTPKQSKEDWASFAESLVC